MMQQRVDETVSMYSTSAGFVSSIHPADAQSLGRGAPQGGQVFLRPVLVTQNPWPIPEAFRPTVETKAFVSFTFSSTCFAC